MHKRIITKSQQNAAHPDLEWLNMEELAEVEITSEDMAHPIESALFPDRPGWRAAGPGSQIIRLIFHTPQRLRWIKLKFVELHEKRTQEFLLRWSPDGGKSFHDIVRQQWNFNPGGASSEETEDINVDLDAATVLELSIIPDISGGNAVASLAQLQLA